MIKDVRKVKIIVPKEKKDELLLTLQKEEIVMLPMHGDNGIVDLSFEEEIISRSTNALKKLGSYIKKNRKFFQHETVKYEDFIIDSNVRINMLEEIENKFDELNFLSSENKEEEKLIKHVEAYKDLNYSTKELFDSLYVTFLFGYVPESRWEFFKSYTEKDDVSFFEYETNELGHNILIVLDNESLDKKQVQIKRFGFVEYEMPVLDESIKNYIENKSKIINDNINKISETEDFLAKSNNYELEIKILADQMHAEAKRKLIIYKEDSKDITFEGWISTENAQTLQRVVKKVTLEYQLEFDEPQEFDDVPTLLDNPKLVKPFESITSMYSVPNYHEVDPNPVMSFWYWAIFGTLIGDVGYGVLMLILFGLFLKFKKPKGEFADLVKIMFLSAIPAILSGLAFSSFFGVSLGYKPLISPLNEPLTMLFFSLGVGVLHLISGLVLKVVNSFKRKDYLDGLSKGMSWILILLGASIFAINMGLKISNVLQTVGIVIIVLGVIVMYICTGLQHKSIFGKLFGGLSGLFGITSYLSDILSYSRILALVLSTSIIATTMNLLAGLIQGSVVGFLLSIVVYIVGHIFTLVMGLLSAYVHTGRLQYLEFFGKFYEGGGYLFEPLSFDTKYINEVIK